MRESESRRAPLSENCNSVTAALIDAIVVTRTGHLAEARAFASEAVRLLEEGKGRVRLAAPFLRRPGASAGRGRPPTTPPRPRPRPRSASWAAQYLCRAVLTITLPCEESVWKSHVERTSLRMVANGPIPPAALGNRGLGVGGRTGESNSSLEVITNMAMALSDSPRSGHRSAFSTGCPTRRGWTRVDVSGPTSCHHRWHQESGVLALYGWSVGVGSGSPFHG